jgi:hypothetical protein
MLDKSNLINKKKTCKNLFKNNNLWIGIMNRHIRSSRYKN